MTEITEAPAQITISELPELLLVNGTETLPIDSYNVEDEKQETLKVSVANIKSFILNGLEGSVTPEQIQAWDAKETTEGAQDKADAALLLAKEYTDTEIGLHTLLLEDKADVSALEGLATTESVTLALADKADVSALAGKADVTALEGLATTESVTSALADKADVSALEGLATTESVTSALAGKADVTALADKVDSDYLDLALADKADVAVDFVTVAEAYTIEEKDLGKVLFVTADVTLTVSDQATLTEGFNCKIIKAEDTLTVGVELTGSDSIRGDIGTVEGDVTLIKAPVAGKFLLV